MIITVTPNPALDVSGIVETLVPNEKSYVLDEHRYPGGNGINAARIVHRLGGSVLATGFLGGNTGKEIAELLLEEKLPGRFVSIKGRTRSNITISLKASHEQTRLSFPGPKINRKEIALLLSLIQAKKPSLLVLGGSLPEGFTSVAVNKIIHEFNKVKVPVFVDMPGKIQREIISAGPYFIKPNLTEFQEMIGKKVTKINDVLRAARKLCELVPLQCISSVEGGALLVTKDHCWYGRIPEVEILSTVGAGDSMVGAMAYCFHKNEFKFNESCSEEMLRLGLAAACATLTNKGLTMGTRAKIKEFKPQIFIQQIE